MEELITRYGLLAIFAGAGLEGEPFALAGGVLAHRNWISPYAAVLAVIAGAFCVDQFWFHLSRNFRDARLVRSVTQRTAFQRALGLIERHPIWFVLLFRFAYGLRAVATVAIGTSNMPTRQFVPLNIAAATIWGLIYTGIGYTLGPALAELEATHGFGVIAMSVGVAVLVLILLVRGGRR